MKGLILISTVAFSLASFAASASEAPSESVCSLTHRNWWRIRRASILQGL